MNPEQIIVQRLVQELHEAQTVVLGPGIPQLSQSHLPEGVQARSLPPNGAPSTPVDLVVVEADEISEKGDLSLSKEQKLAGVQAARWIVATPHTRGDGEAKIVRSCRLPVSRPGCVRTIITELGVIHINETGLVLTEVAPGVATDDVKKKTAASLHIADDIKLMKI